jgi:ubiquitin conjugation factor E4 A
MHPTMTDPVTLPASGQVLDRRTILRHLSKADKPDDPFSRTPLTADMLIANDTLRDKIQSWLLTQRHGGSSGSD